MAETSVRLCMYFVLTSLYVFMTVLIIFAPMWSYSILFLQDLLDCGMQDLLVLG